MRQTTKNVYSSSMVLFYMVCHFNWKLYDKYWEDFAGFSNQYTKEFGQNELKATDTAQALPDVA